MKLLVIFYFMVLPITALAQAPPIELEGKTIFKNEIKTSYINSEAYDKIKKWLLTLDKDLGKSLIKDDKKNGLIVVKHSNYSRRDSSMTVLVVCTFTIKVSDYKVVSEASDFYSIFFMENNTKTEEPLEKSLKIFVDYANGQGIDKFTKEEFDDRRNIVFKVDQIQSDLYLGLVKALK